MRRYPATVDAQKVIKSLAADPNVRNVDGHSLIVALTGEHKRAVSPQTTSAASLKETLRPTSETLLGRSSVLVSPNGCNGAGCVATKDCDSIT